MRLSRPCYDKPHRCPGWAGGGMHYADKITCESGSIRVRPRRFVELIWSGEKSELWDGYPASFPFRFGHCNKCDVVTWPWFTRRLDPSYWRSKFRSVKQRTQWRIEDWRKYRE